VSEGRGTVEQCPSTRGATEGSDEGGERKVRAWRVGMVTRKSLCELVRLQRAIGAGGDAMDRLDGEVRRLFVS
jgi:hypothetical protein